MQADVYKSPTCKATDLQSRLWAFLDALHRCTKHKGEQVPICFQNQDEQVHILYRPYNHSLAFHSAVDIDTFPADAGS